MLGDRYGHQVKDVLCLKLVEISYKELNQLFLYTLSIIQQVDAVSCEYIAITCLRNYIYVKTRYREQNKAFNREVIYILNWPTIPIPGSGLIFEDYIHNTTNCFR